jgi:hypothetical protein
MVWTKILDPSTQRFFFFDTQTGQSVWELEKFSPNKSTQTTTNTSTNNTPTTAKKISPPIGSKSSTHEKTNHQQKPPSSLENNSVISTTTTNNSIYNTPTKNTISTISSAWKRHVDPKTSRPFWYNSITKESTWVDPSLPLSATSTPKHSSSIPPSPSIHSSQNGSVLLLSNNTNNHHHRNNNNTGDEWISCVDPASNNTFWHNTRTKISTWTKPFFPNNSGGGGIT